MKRNSIIAVFCLCCLSSLGGHRLHSWGMAYVIAQKREIACTYLDQRLLQLNTEALAKGNSKKFASIIQFIENECWTRR